jgi:hypothetical protein
MIMSSKSASVAVLALAGLLLISGCAAPASPQGGRELGTVEEDPFRSARTDTFVSSSDILTTVKSEPTRLVVEALGIDMPVEPHGLLEGGIMSLPESPFTAGWYEFGAAPNSPSGATVLAAHVDSRVLGIGPLAALRTAQPGTQVSLTDSAGVIHVYNIVAVEKITKSVVPWGQYFSMVGDQRLVLITCGGEFIEEIRNYTDNYIVTAEKVS